MITKTSLKPLIMVNNDRHEGYTTAAELTKDNDLKGVFTRLSEQSRSFADELRRHADKGEEVGRDETSISGKLSRTWLSIKSAVTANDRKSILSSCIAAEKNIGETYDEALREREGLPTGALEVINRQRDELRRSHDEIKALSDRVA
jgi:uncharacterized protein (TIGR02284 family)